MKLICQFIGSFKISKSYECRVKSAAITEHSTVIKEIQGDHRAGRSNKDVQTIWFHDCKVHFMPRGLEDFFPHVFRLQITNCGLRSICRDDLRQFKNLEWLCFTNNKLTSLPDDLFQDTPMLTRISFDKNKIGSMSSKLFDPIINNKFTWIDFRNNVKIDELYLPLLSESVKSVAALMEIIDSQCSKPEPIALQTSFDASQIYHQNFPKGFEDLFDSDKFSDFVITVNCSKQFRVHKLVLAAYCEGFAEIFEKDPTTSDMNIEDSSPETVEKFLRFLYTGKLENFAEHSLAIFALSSKLKSFSLKDSIEKFIVAHIKNFDAFKVFSMAHSFKSDKLKRAAFEAIQKNLGRKLPKDFIENLEKVKQIVDIWKKFDSLAKNEGK